MKQKRLNHLDLLHTHHQRTDDLNLLLTAQDLSRNSRRNSFLASTLLSLLPPSLLPLLALLTRLPLPALSLCSLPLVSLSPLGSGVCDRERAHSDGDRDGGDGRGGEDSGGNFPRAGPIQNGKFLSLSDVEPKWCCCIARGHPVCILCTCRVNTLQGSCSSPLPTTLQFSNSYQ